MSWLFEISFERSEELISKVLFLPCVPMRPGRTSFVHGNILHRVRSQIMEILLLLLLNLIVILYSKVVGWCGL